MSDERLEAVRQLVRDGNYDAALQILYQMNDARVAKWIKQVEQKRADAKTRKRANRRKLTRAGKIAIGVIVTIILGTAIIGTWVWSEAQKGYARFLVWEWCWDSTRGDTCDDWAEKTYEQYKDIAWQCSFDPNPGICLRIAGVPDDWDKTQ